MILCLSVILFSCNKKEETTINNLTVTDIDGVVQKGPFLNGTSIDIFELKDDCSPTGKSFSSQIIDNSGTFKLENVSLLSKYVLLKANGFYFNEITGQNSNSQVTLYSISDITNRTSVNVNILSNLEKNRIEYLLTRGISFSVAKKQAEQEILKIFSITKPDIIDFELLNISEEGEDNAVLLAVSVILQGYRSESELSDLMANISTDIRQDGTLDSLSLGTLLINDAHLLDLPRVRQNIETRYAGLGMNVTIPNFEKYVKIFTDSTHYQITNNIVYPEFSNYGENILYGDKTMGSSVAANLPKGSALKIIIKGGLWAYQAAPNPPVNWTISPYAYETQTFTATESGKNCDLMFMWMSSGTHTIEYYENNAATPTRIKIVNN